MKNRKFPALLFIGSVLGVGIGFVLSNAYKLGMCGASVFCRGIIDVGDALLYSMAVLAVIFLILTLLPKVFSAWGRFAIWAVPFMYFHFAIYKDDGFITVPEASFYLFLSKALAVLSAIVIGWTLLSAKLNKNTPVKTHILPQGKILRIWWYVYLVVILLVIVSRFLS